ncbi:MAG: MBL fold metallo-hydrolase [Acidobacteriia bacterium]|nr:MBL fold metallo-hydrolase [Terriglobia bacterium]
MGLTVLFLFVGCSFALAQLNETSKTQIVLLGTGTPAPDPERSGPSTAIVVNGTAYLIDFGAGVVRQAAAARKKGVQGLEPANLRIGFITHLHSDHTLGFPDLILTPWVVGRKEPLEVYGPPGTSDMAEHILKAYGADIDIRTGVKITTGASQHSNISGYKVNVHEIQPGVVYKDENVTVTAFAVHHGKWAHAYGYKFETQDRIIVISGDTSPDAAIGDNCHGCDVQIHEVYTQASFDKVSPEWKQYRLAYHTSSKELAEVATKAKPGLLILYHRANPGCDQARTEECREAGSEEQLLKEIRQAYKGKVAAGHDLEIY